MLSLFVAFITSNLLFQGRAHSAVNGILIDSGEKMINTYQTTPTADLITFMENFSGMVGLRIQLYNQDGQALLSHKENLANQSDIELIIAGKIAENIQNKRNHFPIVGIPFQDKGRTYALFLTVEKNSVEDELMNSIHLMYVIIFFLGSLLIIIAARYIVGPIVRLTAATKKMAKGHFDVEIPTSRKDEIGVLSQSFNEMANELSKLDRMRKEFVANVSHEIQSPLTSISGFSKALKQKKMTEESRIQYLSIIEEESERLSRLSQNLLRLSYLQQENYPMEVVTYRLDEQLRKVVIAQEPQWSAKAIDIAIQLEPITIQADEDQFQQVWTNLLGNSIKFTPEKGSIVIEAMTREQQAIVSITDSGIGIPEEERVDIFKAFHKVDRTRNSSVKGNGLGLAIVKQIVDIHKGEIEVTGAPGKGARFTVELPLNN
jgi:signal transduction histidine kinase